MIWVYFQVYKNFFPAKRKFEKKKSVSKKKIFLLWCRFRNWTLVLVLGTVTWFWSYTKYVCKPKFALELTFKNEPNFKYTYFSSTLNQLALEFHEVLSPYWDFYLNFPKYFKYETNNETFEKRYVCSLPSYFLCS